MAERGGSQMNDENAVRDLVKAADASEPEPEVDLAASLADIKQRAGRLALLTGGGTVYVYVEGDWRIPHQRAVLDVAYPAEEIQVFTVPVGSYTPDMVAELRGQGLEIVDCRESAKDEPE